MEIFCREMGEIMDEFDCYSDCPFINLSTSDDEAEEIVQNCGGRIFDYEYEGDED